MVEYEWVVKVDGTNEEVVWDSESKLLVAPLAVSLAANQIIEEEREVYVGPVGPTRIADLDEPLAAFGTILYAIEMSGYEIVEAPLAPIEPEPDLEEGNPANG